MSWWQEKYFHSQICRINIILNVFLFYFCKVNVGNQHFQDHLMQTLTYVNLDGRYKRIINYKDNTGQITFGDKKIHYKLTEVVYL